MSASLLLSLKDVSDDHAVDLTRLVSGFCRPADCLRDRLLLLAAWPCSQRVKPNQAQFIHPHTVAVAKSRQKLPPPDGGRGLMKVTDVTLDVVQAQDRSLVGAAVLVLLIGAATQLVFYHLEGLKTTVSTRATAEVQNILMVMGFFFCFQSKLYSK